MKSLTYLNTRGETNVSVTDNRPAGVIFNRVVPYQAVDQTNTISSTSPTINPGIEIVEIINGATANVRYRVEIVRGSASPLPTSSITFASLPTGVTQSIAGTVYTLSGIDSLSDWNIIKLFTWNLPADYASYPLWYLKVSVIYYDGATAADKTKSWLVYDDRFYYVAQLSTTATSTASVLKVKRGEAVISATGSTVTATITRRRQLSATITTSSSLSAVGSISIARLESTMTLSVNARRNLIGASTLSTTSTVTCNADVVYTNDLRIQVYHDVSRTTFTATVQTYSTNLIVYWGDGTSTSYTGLGTYRSHSISKTYTGTGYKDIKVASSAVTRFVPNTGAGLCYIYKIYQWSVVPAVTNTYLSESDYTDQIMLNEVPTTFPTNVTSLFFTFVGCTNLNHSNISSWNLSNMTSIRGVLAGCTSFNQSVSSWNVSNTPNLRQVFVQCTSFNQPLPWTISSAAIAPGGSNTQEQMLSGCTSFNQDLTSMSGYGYMFNFLTNCDSFSNVNYNKFLISLANQVYSAGGTATNTLTVPAEVTETSTSYGSGTYTTGQAAYSYLTSSPRNWNISKNLVTVSISTVSSLTCNALKNGV
jgi:hypothetical protein